MDKIITVEELKYLYDSFKDKGLPEFTSAQEGCILSVIDGQLAWVKINNTDTPSDNDDLETGYIWVTNDLVSENPHKESGVTWSVDESTHSISVTFSAISQGVLIDTNDITADNTVSVLFDEVIFTETDATAQAYLGLYAGTTSDYATTTGYNNTSGIIIEQDDNYPGIQINSSSRFVTNGGTLPTTITFKRFRFKID